MNAAVGNVGSIMGSNDGSFFESRRIRYSRCDLTVVHRGRKVIRAHVGLTNQVSFLAKCKYAGDATHFRCNHIRKAIFSPTMGRIYGRAYLRSNWVMLSPPTGHEIRHGRIGYLMKNLRYVDAKFIDEEEARLTEYGEWSDFGFIARSRSDVAKIMLSTDMKRYS